MHEKKKKKLIELFFIQYLITLF